MRPIFSCPIQAFLASVVLLVANIGGCPPQLSPAGDQRRGSPIPAGVYSGEVSYHSDTYSGGELYDEYSSTAPITCVFNETGQYVGPDGNPVVSGTTTVNQGGGLTVTKSVGSAIAMADSVIIQGMARWDETDLPGDPATGPFTITFTFVPPNQVEYEEFISVWHTSVPVGGEMTWSGILTK